MTVLTEDFMNDKLNEAIIVAGLIGVAVLFAVAAALATESVVIIVRLMLAIGFGWAASWWDTYFMNQTVETDQRLPRQEPPRDSE